MKFGVLTSLAMSLLFSQTRDFVPLVSVEMAFASVVAKQEEIKNPVKQECCKECKQKGYVTHSDGHNTVCLCPDSCQCKKGFKK